MKHIGVEPMTFGSVDRCASTAPMFLYSVLVGFEPTTLRYAALQES